MAVLVRDALNGVAWDASVTKVLGLVRASSASEGTGAALEAALNASAPASRDQIRALCEGWVGGEALAIGVYAARVSRSFAESIELLRNDGIRFDGVDRRSIVGCAARLLAMPKDAACRLDALGPLLEVTGKWENHEASVVGAALCRHTRPIRLLIFHIGKWSAPPIRRCRHLDVH